MKLLLRSVRVNRRRRGLERGRDNSRLRSGWTGAAVTLAEASGVGRRRRLRLASLRSRPACRAAALRLATLRNRGEPTSPVFFRFRGRLPATRDL